MGSISRGGVSNDVLTPVILDQIISSMHGQRISGSNTARTGIQMERISVWPGNLSILILLMLPGRRHEKHVSCFEFHLLIRASITVATCDIGRWCRCIAFLLLQRNVLDELGSANLTLPDIRYHRLRPSQRKSQPGYPGRKLCGDPIYRAPSIGHRCECGSREQHFERIQISAIWQGRDTSCRSGAYRTNLATQRHWSRSFAGTSRN